MISDASREWIEASLENGPAWVRNRIAESNHADQIPHPNPNDTDWALWLEVSRRME